MTINVSEGKTRGRFEFHTWGGIESRGEERDTLKVRLSHPVVPLLSRHALPVRLQPIPEHGAGVEDGHAVLEEIKFKRVFFNLLGMHVFPGLK